MVPKVSQKIEAIKLREKGYSYSEIANRLGVSKGSMSLWVRDVKVSIDGRRRLQNINLLRQSKVIATKKRKVKETFAKYKTLYQNEIGNSELDVISGKALCSLMFWCEGGKDHYRGMQFTNSDPRVVKTFITPLKTYFKIDNSKFKPCIHLHEYHNKERQLIFWSKITDIPKKQFSKCYIKPHTGKRIKVGYPGCISLRYNSNDLTRELLTVADVILEKFSGASVNW